MNLCTVILSGAERSAKRIVPRSRKIPTHFTSPAQPQGVLPKLTPLSGRVGKPCMNSRGHDSRIMRCAQ